MHRIPLVFSLVLFFGLSVYSQYEGIIPPVKISFDLTKLKRLDFDALPARFRFTATQKFTRNATTLMTEKPLVTIQYTDSKGTAHEQVVTTQNTRIK